MKKIKTLGIALVLLVITLLLLLAGCGTKTASNKRIQEDLHNSSAFSGFANCLGLEITSLDIQKRQTTKESKVDTIWVEATVESDTVRGVMYYVLTYNLYNDGWLLDTITDDNTENWYFEPLCGASDTYINSFLPEDAVIVANEVNLEYATNTVTYTYTEQHRYCDIIYNKQLIFDFNSGYSPSGADISGRWELRNTIDAGSYEVWNIVGTWTVEDSSDGFGWMRYTNYTIEIEDFTPGNAAYNDDTSDDEFYAQGHYYSSYYRENNDSNVVYDRRTSENKNGLFSVKVAHDGDGNVDHDENGNVYYWIDAIYDIWREETNGTETVSRNIMRISPDAVEVRLGYSNAFRELEKEN